MNRDNLRALAKLLREVAKPEHFDMSVFFRSDTNRSACNTPTRIVPTDYNECGTVACALGHAPLLFPPLPTEFTFWAYGARVFDLSNDEWNFVFHYRWGHVDNTPKGAAQRIEYLLARGCPTSLQISAMISGIAPLIYKENSSANTTV